MKGKLSLRKMAVKWDTSVPTLSRHFKNCSNVPPVPDAPDPTFTETLPVTSDSFNAYERILKVQAEFEELLQAAKDAGNDMLRMMALGEIRKTVESMVKIFEAQQKIAMMYRKEDVSASVVYRWMTETHPEILEELTDYLGRELA